MKKFIATCQRPSIPVWDAKGFLHPRRNQTGCGTTFTNLCVVFETNFKQKNGVYKSSCPSQNLTSPYHLSISGFLLELFRALKLF
ncbi:hypothetical protein MRB53_024823 [Persea americana]|uniref:Uncharacterized protein n=1 Tax=Persea americana TaxID=3435 RepID=A0ACC2LDH0_PERAE|nr:hypothetical protein MRB53_024823 [Persea americana]